MNLLRAQELIAWLNAQQHRAPLIAIDGLPLAGKSTLAHKLARALNGAVISIDEFVRPAAEWAAATPAFPFPFFRNAVFADALTDLREHSACAFHPYLWETDALAKTPRRVTRDRPIIVEGTGVLSADLAQLYDARIFVESDEETLWAARTARDGESWSAHWRDLFLPSVALYMQTRPQDRADIAAAGRGA